MEKHIASISGGKDSTALALMALERKIRIDEYIFCDTGMEFPQMYKHISKLEQMLDTKITVLKADKDFKYYMLNHKKKNGKIGYAWPDFRNRWCTSALKKDVIRRYLKKYKDAGYEVIEYHGIAFDEQHRAKKNKEKNIRYPLIEWQITEKQALDYCYSRGFDWEGLYKQSKRVSCWCCPLQSLKDLKSLYVYHRGLWEELKELDKLSWNKFRLDYTLEQLEKRFEIEERQIKMF